MRVIALSALVMPLGFIAQGAHQYYPLSSEYATVLEDPGRSRSRERYGLDWVTIPGADTDYRNRQVAGPLTFFPARRQTRRRG